MRKLAVAVALAAATFTSTSAAQAHPNYHYTGGCSVAIVSADTSNTPSWRFVTTISAMATNIHSGAPEAVPIKVECWLRINGVGHGYLASANSEVVVVTPPQSTSVTAAMDAVFTVCDEVTVGGDFHMACFDIEPTHADGPACRLTNGDVYVGDKIVYDCPPYDG